MAKRQTKSIKTPNSYAKTRYNATKHGTLSCVPVLPWEDANEFAKLHEALMQEYQPQGASEEHLVTEIANCIFRKQRLYKAENALIVQRISSSSYFLKRDADLLTPSSNLKTEGSSLTIDLKQILYEERPDQEYDRALIAHKKYLRDVQTVVDANLSYEEMLEQCPPDAIELWRDWLMDDGSGYVESKQSFMEFLQTEVIDWCENDLSIKQSLPQLRQQLVGLSYVPCDKMENLQRHEAALDRRFERNMVMLLRLQEVRKANSAVIVTDTSVNSVL